VVGTQHVVIVGGGVVGLSTAYYVARQGHRVTLLDRAPAEHEGCSYGNAGYVVPSHFVPLAAPGMVALGLKWMLRPDSPFYIKPRLDAELAAWCWRFFRAANTAHVARAAPLLRDLNLASRACFQELAERTGNEFGLTQRGLLCLFKDPRQLEKETHLVAQAVELGLQARVLDARRTAELEPNVRLDVVGAVFFQDDCHLAPARFLAVLKREVEQLGATLLWQTPVTGWQTRGARVLAARTPQGDVAADEFVVCGGAWSPVIVRDLDLRLPVQAGKGYSLTLPKPRQLPSLPMILSERRVAVTPMGRCLRFGGTMELAGLQEEINPVRVRAIIDSVPAYCPDFTPDDFTGVQPWCGLRPCSPDGLPYLGRTRRYSNLCVATGHAMMGLSLGPISGKLIAQILSGQRPSIDLSLLAPDRYG
jgi:D-amino-acid dehydrogenase